MSKQDVSHPDKGTNTSELQYWWQYRSNSYHILTHFQVLSHYSEYPTINQILYPSSKSGCHKHSLKPTITMSITHPVICVTTEIPSNKVVTKGYHITITHITNILPVSMLIRKVQDVLPLFRKSIAQCYTRNQVQAMTTV